ncbi:SWI-SNF chromatin remodeling complex, Snf5 subunit [Phaffia rhodozyma]|uniref:SWI-SNF chromatin remodeling complex, Snf5 subunit n=1 Tax=Phaffia rhodozyma TaxID=264483 RepID=A0A0F7SKS2_PHARH|nr:SWI-SNF chromatin remodeling complex, Snf5 subunit [Phaffia rhodozyma]
MAGPPLSEPVDQSVVAQLLQDLSRKMPPSELNSVLSQIPSSVQPFHPTGSSSMNPASAQASSVQRSASQSLEGALQGLQQLHGGLGLGIPPPASHPYQVNQHVPTFRSQAPTSTPTQYQLPPQTNAYPASKSAQYARPPNSFSYANSSTQHHPYSHPPPPAPPGSYATGYGQPRQPQPSYNQAVSGAPSFRPQHASPAQSYNPTHSSSIQYNPQSDRPLPPSSKQSPSAGQHRPVGKRMMPVPQPTVPVRRGPGRPPGPSKPKDTSALTTAAAKSLPSPNMAVAKHTTSSATPTQAAQFIPKPAAQYLPPAHVLPPPYIPPSQTNPFRLYQHPAPPSLPLIGPAAAAATLSELSTLSSATEDEVMTAPSFTSSGEPGVPSPAYPLFAPAATNRQRNAQATFTSYASRLRTGVSVLMQPILNQVGTATPGTTSPFPGLDRGGRRRGPVNYAELNDGKSDEEEDVDGTDGGPGRPKRLKRGDSGTSVTGKPTKRELEREEPRTYLGMRPPADKISLRTAIKTKHLYFDDDKLGEAAKAKEVLIPIRVDVDTDTHRIRDCFTWNLKESLLTPEQFARIFCQDIDLPIVPHAESIATQIRAQLDEFSDIAEVDVTYDESIHLAGVSQHGQQSSEGEKPMNQPKFVSIMNDVDDEQIDAEELDGVDETQDITGVVVEGDEDEANGEEDTRDKKESEGEDEKKEEELEVEEVREEEEEDIDESQAESDCRIIVNLDVQISTLTLRDRIEWDLSSTLTPEHFAQTLVSDLGLPHESIPLISHAIHEELLRHKKDCLEWGFLGPGWSLHAKDRERARGGLGGGTILGGFGPNGGPKGLKGAWRGWDEAEEFQPILSEVSLEEIERKEFERERAIRRMRRETAKFTQDLSRSLGIFGNLYTLRLILMFSCLS